jgi:DNA-binding MarR family transcriptional regulator
VDYTELAKQLLNNKYQLRKGLHQKKIDETMQGEAFVIMYISKRGGDVLPSEISNKMNISSARVAAALNSLETKGQITRTMDPNDRRKILVDLTESGKQLAERYEQKALDGAKRMLEFLGEQDAKEFVRIMGRLAKCSSEGTNTEG